MRGTGVLRVVDGCLAALALGLLALLAWGPGAGHPHQAPVGVVAPGVVSDLLGHDHPLGRLRLVSVPGEAEARREVLEGDLVAAIVVELPRPRDTLVVDTRRNADLVRAVRRELARTEQAYGRRLDVVDAAPAGTSGTSERVDRAITSAAVAGFVLGLLVLAPGRSRSARGQEDLRVREARLVRTLLGLLTWSAAIGSVVSVVPGLDTGAEWWRAALTLSAVVLATGLVPVACATAAGHRGTVIASGVTATTLAPVLGHVDQLMLPEPWRTHYRFSVPGAAREALVDSATWGPTLVVLAWVVAGLLASVVAVRRQGGWRNELLLVRAAAASVPATTALLVAAAVLPTHTDARPAHDALATTSQCVPVGEPRTVADLNRIAREPRGGEDFWGGDVGADATLQDGRRLWLFGDTVRRPGQLPTFVRNSMLVFDSSCLAAVLPPGGGAVMPDRTDGVGYWPMSVAVTERRGFDLVLVAAQRVRSTGDGAWAFQSLGPSVAALVVPVGDTPQLLGIRDVGKDDAARTRPAWGAAAHVHDDWLYLYGTASEERSFGFSLRVARVRPDDVMRPGAWRFWDGDGWSSDPAHAAELIPAVDGVSQTLSVWVSDGTWYAVSKRNEFLGQDVVVWTAPRPTGPFVARGSVAQIPSDVTAGRLRYMPLAHPELLPRKGSVIISWSNNFSDPEQVLANPRSYRPRFLRVRLPGGSGP